MHACKIFQIYIDFLLDFLVCTRWKITEDVAQSKQPAAADETVQAKLSRNKWWTFNFIARSHLEMFFEDWTQEKVGCVYIQLYCILYNYNNTLGLTSIMCTSIR